MKANEDEEALDQPLYQSVVGSLMYLATCTRPDIAYAVGMLARFSSKPNQSHWTAAKRVLRYLRGTVNFGILYRGESGVLGYSDADWAGDADDRKSTSGYMFLIAGGPVSGNKAPWLYQPHCRLLSKNVCGCRGYSLNWEIHQMVPPLSWKTTSRPLLWQKIRNST